MPAALPPRALARTAARGAALAAAAAAEPAARGPCPALTGMPGAGPGEDAVLTRSPRGHAARFTTCCCSARCCRRRSGATATRLLPRRHAPRDRPLPPPLPDGRLLRSRRPSASPGRRSSTPRATCTGYVAGLPFPPDDDRPEGARRRGCAGPGTSSGATAARATAGQLPARRHAEPHGRRPDLRGRLVLLLQTRHRADLAASDYALPVAAAEPVGRRRHASPSRRTARHLAWRQIRSPDADARLHERPDDTFVYVPTMRKVRRAATPGSTASTCPATASCGRRRRRRPPDRRRAYAAAGGAINPTAGESIAGDARTCAAASRPRAAPERLRLARARRARGARADQHHARAATRRIRDRNFGPSGLSVGSDRWDVR